MAAILAERPLARKTGLSPPAAWWFPTNLRSSIRNPNENLRCTSSGREIFTVPQEFLKVTKTCTASALGKIPPTWFSFEGRRFKLDEWRARVLLAFAQGYTTVLGGPFGSHDSLKPAVPWLREVLLGNSASGAAASGDVP